MRILLIGINSKYIHPAIGIHQIYTNSKYPVDFLEFSIKDNNENIIKAMKNYQLIGFSVYIWNIEKIKEIIKTYKDDAIILLGGPEASYRPELLFFDIRIQYIIKGEGEAAFNELLDYLNNQSKIDDVSNLYYLEKGKLKYTFDRLPELSLIKHDLSLIKDFKNKVCYLEASRGCPFNCSYCLSSLDNKVRFFDYEKIIKEIDFAFENNIKIVKFLDRTFNLKQDEMRKILNHIINKDNNYTVFQFEIVGDLLDNKTIDLLQKVRLGQIRFEIGIQSTNDSVTRAVRRKQDLKKLKENILKIKNNIIIHLDLIAGLPYEDKNSFINTFNETFSVFPNELQLGFLKELQGTEISQNKDLHGYFFSPLPPYEVIRNSYLSEDDLDEIRIVEHSLNKYYNSNLYKKTIDYLFSDLIFDPYQTFLKIGSFTRPVNLQEMQPDLVALNLYESLDNLDKERLLFIIKQDYLYKPIKPKLWWESKITRPERKKVYEEFIRCYPQLNLETLYRYSHLEKLENEYYLITYKPLNEYYLKMPS